MLREKRVAEAEMAEQRSVNGWSYHSSAVNVPVKRFVLSWAPEKVVVAKTRQRRDNRCGVVAGCEPLGERPEELSIVDC